MLTGRKRVAPLVFMTPDTSSPALVSAYGCSLASNWWRVVAMIWSGQAFSIITSGASGWAIIWHVNTTEGSALKLAIVMALSQLPLGLLAPHGGIAADHYNRRVVMIISDLGNGGMSLALGRFRRKMGDPSSSPPHYLSVMRPSCVGALLCRESAGCKERLVRGLR